MAGSSTRLDDLGACLARFATTRVIVPLAALVGLALLLSAAAVHQASERQDQLQRQSETKAIEYVIRQLGEALAAEVRDYAWWDEAVRHLLPEPDPDWADQNVGPFVFGSFGYEVLAVLIDGGRPVYGHVEGKRDLAGAVHRLGSSLPRLAALAAEPGSGGMPRCVDAVLTGSDGLYFAAAGPILLSAEASRAHAAGPAGVLVFAKRLGFVFKPTEGALVYRRAGFSDRCSGSGCRVVGRSP